MPVTRFAFETIAAMYGEQFAKAWFTPVSLIHK